MGPTARLIDFAQTDLARDYTGFYAKIIDDAFTPEECTELIETAINYNDEGFVPATRIARESGGAKHSGFRHSDRVLVFDRDIATRVYERLRPFVEDEIGVIEPKSQWAGVTGKEGRKQGPSWALKRVNPRLSFLRYGPGHFFKHHCDGLIEVKEADGVSMQKSFVTLHLYLNDASEGGATRFWTQDKQAWLDVEPKVGRVLVFQQRKLLHTGEEVKGGVKYTMRSDFLFEETQ